MRTAPLVVRRDGAEFSLRRISDNELRRLGRLAASVESDLLFWMEWNSRRRQPRGLSLPEFFVAMTSVFGGSGYAFDDYKSSFCFPFHLTTDKRGVSGDYLLLVEDWKGGIEARLMRRNGVTRADLERFHAFVDAEFSRDDFRYVMNFLEGFLQTTAAGGPLAPPVPDFVHHVDAALLLYGFRNGKPFQQSFGDDDDYATALARVPDVLLDVDIGVTL